MSSPPFAPPHAAAPARAHEETRERAAPAWLSLFLLETRARTIAYWAAVTLVSIAVFIPALPPCVDYPQHLGLADIGRRLADPNAPEHAFFQTHWLTYNGLFHWLVARLGTVVPIEIAGKSVMALSLFGLGAATIALVRTLGRPPSYAAFFVPAIFSFSVTWGFANYALGTALAAIALVVIARALQKPSVLAFVATAAIGMLTALAHVLGMLILCVMSTALAPEVAWRASAKPGRGKLVQGLVGFGRSFLALAPLLVGCAFCIHVWLEESAWDPKMYHDPTVEGSAPPIWQKLLWFSAFTTDLHSDASDQVLLWCTIVAMAAVVWLAWRKRARDPQPPRAVIVPFAVMFVAYLATPMVLMGTHLIFPRLGQPLLFGAVIALPRLLPGRARERLERAAIGLAAAFGLNLAVHCAIYAHETNDASRVIDDLPEGRRVTAVVYEPSTFGFRNGTLVHMAGYYAARKHGDWAFGFGRYHSVPVRFKPESQPAWPLKGWEFSPWDYDPRCKYARYYDLVIVKAPPEIARDASGEKPLRKLIFPKDADAVRLVSHHGAFWAFDTAGLPEDGAL